MADDLITSSLAPGHLLQNRYEIIREVGRGSLGVVYQARDRQQILFKRMVAIKYLPNQSIIDCERQADTRAFLSHPTIPQIYDFFSIVNDCYLVQELIHGWNLEVFLERNAGFLPEKLLMQWAVSLCSFLDYLHTHPCFTIIFRDLKPNNVMADQDLKLHVVDFGLARLFPAHIFEDHSPHTPKICKGVAIGTEGYSPPEQYEGFVRPESDIYALGATLHHLATRRDPRKEPAFTFHQAPVRSLNPAISQEFETVIMTALQNEPGRRYPSAGEMLHALRTIK